MRRVLQSTPFMVEAHCSLHENEHKSAVSRATSGCCRFMDLETFAVEARAADAVVVVAVQGGLAQSGVLQAFFEMHGVPVTGAPSRCSAIALCRGAFDASRLSCRV